MRLLLAASVILLAACDTTEIAQQQPEVNSGAIALYDERGNFVREYRDVVNQIHTTQLSRFS